MIMYEIIHVISFDTIWNNVKSNQEETFKTITGLEFTYSLEGDYLIPSRTDYKISKHDVHKAFDMLPLDGPGDINDIVRGPAYVWALLHDTRIKP